MFKQPKWEFPTEFREQRPSGPGTEQVLPDDTHDRGSSSRPSAAGSSQPGFPRFPVGDSEWRSATRYVKFAQPAVTLRELEDRRCQRKPNPTATG